MLRVLSLTFLVAAAALAVLAWDVSERLRAPLPIESPQIVQFESGSSLSSLLRKLEGRGILAPARTTLYLRVYARLHGSATQLHAGEYALEPGITALGLLDLLASGDVLEYSFTIIEGWTVRELLAALRAQEAIRWTLGDPAPTADTLMATLDLGDAHAEGQFLPETYRYARGASDVSLLHRAHRAMRRTLDQVWAQRVDGLPLKSAYDALILASIVEKETGQPSERGQIAGVFTRRLQKNMRLQTDPTVIYGIGEAFDGDIRFRDLRRDTPYNTYTRGGLPPTPICLPGRAALEAAVNPAEGSALYFVSRGDGSHVFSDTLEAHNAAVRRYQLRR
ncbi:endolytic transglycosylase MltG [uncultured Abyssibacter sp.]|uniref:endolytic transglycosylase MltG n=1 Tax=uncultured Abyssibacter sp. TaxID=2320202 RepID=UPI0032B2E680